MAEPVAQDVIEDPIPNVRTVRGDFACPGCGQVDFRLVPKAAPRGHLFSILCANCRRIAGTGFPC